MGSWCWFLGVGGRGRFNFGEGDLFVYFLYKFCIVGGFLGFVLYEVWFSGDIC